MEICSYPTIRTKNAQLKKRFQKNQEFFNSYTKQIEELILKGYAKQSSSNSIKGKTWYLPPHGVKHASKLGNVRIVFDCSPNYGGTYLNKRSVLRFLWWEDSDLGGDLLSHEMCVHVFGGNSSPGCCNYAPRKIAMDIEVRYGEEASQTLLHNYYVDDLLKSVKTEELAVRLIRDFKAMCQAGGFTLTKFISNKKMVIQSVPEYDGRNGIKNTDLDTSLPLEKALGVYYDKENNIFRFKIVLKDKPMTRRGMLSIISSIFDPLWYKTLHSLEHYKISRCYIQAQWVWKSEANMAPSLFRSLSRRVWASQLL